MKFPKNFGKWHGKGVKMSLLIFSGEEMKQKKRKNPADTTMRNIRALKKRVAQLEKDVKLLLEMMIKWGL